MEQRIISLLQKILADADSIPEVLKSDNEYYFAYRGVPMSILHGPTRDIQTGPYSLYLYPTSQGRTLEEIARESVSARWDEPDMFAYHCGTYSVVEAKTFADVYNLMRHKHSNLDGLFARLLA